MVAAFLSSSEGYAPASGEIVGILKQMKDDMSGDLVAITKQELASNTRSVQCRLSQQVCPTKPHLS